MGAQPGGTRRQQWRHIGNHADVAGGIIAEFLNATTTDKVRNACQPHRQHHCWMPRPAQSLRQAWYTSATEARTIAKPQQRGLSMSTHPQPDIHIFPTPAALADEAARRFVALAQAAITARERFTVAFSGGSTPRTLHQRLASAPLCNAIDWAKVYVYWSDERLVPPDDAESNFRMARETLLDHVPIPAANIVPVPTVGGTTEDAATAYAETMIAQFGSELPQFDLILLGMGPDGHTASLFPGQPEPTAPGDALVLAVHHSPKPPPDRVSFSYKLINAARTVLLLVAGADKAETVRQVLRGAPDRAKLPVQGVQPTHGQLSWLLDEAAARDLQ